MRQTSINEVYRLQDLTVDPDRLLLDPTNPRIILETREAMNFARRELTKRDIQDYILSVIKKDEFHVKDLINGIERDGFLAQGNDMIVEEVEDSGKYLVIEGNRRLTAIKHLLERGETLNQSVLKSLREIKVKEFIFTGGDGVSREQVIFKLLGLIHITGALDWGAMEKAFYINRSYEYELVNAGHGNLVDYVLECAQNVSELLNIPLKDVRKHLAIYRVYDQLLKAKYPVKHDDFSLIELAIKTRKLNDEYFGLDPHKLNFSRRGVDRFAELCLGEITVINNPKDFKNFATIFKDGTDYELRLAESGEDTIDRIVERLYRRLEKKQFFASLGAIRDDLEDLFVADFQGTAGEVDVIGAIKEIVDQKLLPLVKSSDGHMKIKGLKPTTNQISSKSRAVKPKSIEEALSLSLSELSSPIQDVLRSRPNKSCVRAYLPTYLLKKWKIRSRSEPRSQFCKLTDAAIGELVARGTIRAYKASNERIRLEEDD